MSLMEKLKDYIVKKSLEEGREYAFALCDSGVHVVAGEESSVSPPRCPVIVHTHFLSPKLSSKDIEEAKKHGIPVLCAVHVGTGETECILEGVELREEYNFKEELKENEDWIYTLEKILEHTILIEEHFKAYPCWWCLRKHFYALRGYLDEMITIDNENKEFWKDVKERAFKVLELYDSEKYLECAEKIREIRKFIERNVLSKMYEKEYGEHEYHETLELTQSCRKDEWKWELKKPKTPSERDELYRKCGDKCFLNPPRGFPICAKGDSTCTIDCDGLRASYVRARALITASLKAGRKDLAEHYRRIAEKALSLAKSCGCVWSERHTLRELEGRKRLKTGLWITVDKYGAYIHITSDVKQKYISRLINRILLLKEILGKISLRVTGEIPLEKNIVYDGTVDEFVEFDFDKINKIAEKIREQMK